MKLKDIRPDVLAEARTESSDVDKAPAPGKLGEYITVKQAAKILDVSPGRVRQFIQEKRLKAHSPEVGRRDNLLNHAEVIKLSKEPREITGRPDEGKGFAEKDKKD